MAIIEIICKSKGGRSIVIDEASNKKDARQQVNYWQNLKGKDWKVFTKAR